MFDDDANRMAARRRVSKAMRERQRAATLLLRAYEEARRAMTFVRWYERDVDKLVPPLRGRGRAGRRSARKKHDEPGVVHAE